MGGCCSRCCPKDESASLEAEMTANPKPQDGKSLSISRAMSAPTVELEGRNVVRTKYRCVSFFISTFYLDAHHLVLLTGLGKWSRIGSCKH